MTAYNTMFDPVTRKYLWFDGSDWRDSKNDVVPGPPSVVASFTGDVTGSGPVSGFHLALGPHAARHRPGGSDPLGLAPVALSGAYADLAGRPVLAAVATSGAYGDLSGRPALFDGSYASLSGKPVLFGGAYADLSGKPALFSGAYAALTGKPVLAVVATSGAYVDLSGRPTLATVAATGSYTDLANKPALPVGFDAACTLFRDRITTIAALPVVVRSIPVPLNTLLAVEVVGTYRSAGNLLGGAVSSIGAFGRGPVGNAYIVGSNDLWTVDNVTGTPTLTYAVNGGNIDIVVNGKSAITLVWCLRTMVDAGNVA